MKKGLLGFAFFFVGLSVQLMAQEVITDQNGQRVVVDSSGQWRYFQQGDTTPVLVDENVFSLPALNVLERQSLLSASQQTVRELTLAVIRQRVQLVDIQIAQMSPTVANQFNLSEQLAQTLQRIGGLENELKTAKSRTELLLEINSLPIPVYERKLAKWEVENRPQPQQKIAILKKRQAIKKLVPNDIAYGIVLLPPLKPCQGGLQIVDPQTNQLRWETVPSKLFSHTDIALERQFLKRDFVECAGNLTALKGGVKMLNLEIAVTTSNAAQIFGELTQNEFVALQLVNGDEIKLFNGLANNGQWDVAQDAFVYKGSFAFGYREEKLLKLNEVDKILVRWSKVQEVFEVYETDFFIRHLRCLNAIVLK